MSCINNRDSRWKNSFWLGLIVTNYLMFMANQFDAFHQVNFKYSALILCAVLVILFYSGVFTKNNLNDFMAFANKEKKGEKYFGRFLISMFWGIGFAVLFFL